MSSDSARDKSGPAFPSAPLSAPDQDIRRAPDHDLWQDEYDTSAVDSMDADGPSPHEQPFPPLRDQPPPPPHDQPFPPLRDQQFPFMHDQPVLSPPDQRPQLRNQFSASTGALVARSDGQWQRPGIQSAPVSPQLLVSSSLSHSPRPLSDAPSSLGSPYGHGSATPPADALAASTDSLVRLVNALAGGFNSLNVSAAQQKPAHRCTDGVEILSEINGCEVYYYADPAVRVSCARLHGILTYDDLYLTKNVLEMLSVYVDPERPQGANILCFNGEPHVGIATTIHAYCRQNCINVIDCHNSVGLSATYDDILVQRIQSSREPCVLIMHRFDRQWEVQHRFETMGRLYDRWMSLAKTSRGCVRALIWVTSLGDIGNVYPLIARNPRVCTASVGLEDWAEHDIVDMLQRLLRARNYESVLSNNELHTIATNTDVLSTPGRVHDVVTSVLDSRHVNYTSFTHAIAHFRRIGHG